MDWANLLKGELRLTADILLGFAIGMAVIRSGLADRLMRRALPLLKKAGIGASLGMALTVSLGSAKAGAALIASALGSGKISRENAQWGTLMLAFPAYLHRWPSTLIMASSLAGAAGAIFAAILLLRSAARFLALLLLLKKDDGEEAFDDASSAENTAKMPVFGMKLLRTLPLAWFFYAAAVMIVPWAEKALRGWLLSSSMLPLSALSVAAASFAHVSAALALAGGSLAAGELSTAQAVFALLLGNSLSLVTRLVRANAGYYFGLFPRSLAQSMLFWNVLTSALAALAALLIAAVPLRL